MGVIGITFSVVTVIDGFSEGAGGTFAALVVGLVPGGAHAVVSLRAGRWSVAYVYASGLTFVGDLLLAVFVEARAVALVAFTSLLGALAASNPARCWMRHISNPTGSGHLLTARGRHTPNLSIETGGPAICTCGPVDRERDFRC